MSAEMEVRGMFFQVLKQVFPHISELAGEGLEKYFRDIDGEARYDAAALKI